MICCKVDLGFGEQFVRGPQVFARVGLIDRSFEMTLPPDGRPAESALSAPHAPDRSSCQPSAKQDSMSQTAALDTESEILEQVIEPGFAGMSLETGHAAISLRCRRRCSDKRAGREEP